MARLYRVESSRNRRRAEYVADDVAYLTIGFVNVYFIGSPGGSWMLVDTGLPGSAAWTLRVAAELFGGPPDGIILTHGHFDHAGAADELSRTWRVPVFAHPLELPYLTGRSDYPPVDASMGGAIAHMARAFPSRGVNLGRRVRALPPDGTVPGLPDWLWLHTPGHTPGHVSLYRPADRALIAGDALATMDLDSWIGIATESPALARPAAPMTSDWIAAHESVLGLAGLEPATIGAGHGVPVVGREIQPALRRLAVDFPFPSRGRYVEDPAIADETGVTELPPAGPDPYPARLMATLIGVFAGVLLVKVLR